MASTAYGQLGMEEWVAPVRRAAPIRIVQGLWRFARRKPLGAVCGVVIVFFLIIGDLIPETINATSSALGIADQPVPYLADTLSKNFSFIYDYREQDLTNRLAGPSSEHLLGTDQLGRDILSRLIYGARVAVIVAMGAVLITSILNVVVSVPAGYFGGLYDKLMYRIVDVADALPTLIILIVILGIFGSGLWPMVFVIGVVQGIGGRTLRGQTMTLVNTPFVESARAVGASHFSIIVRHILPNIFHLIILLATIRLGGIVLLEATLSFLGYGIPPPYPTWGQMLSLEGRQYMQHVPGLAIYPGLTIGLLVFSFNLFGDALRDVLDPRLRGSR